MKFSIKAMVITVALLWGGAVLVVAAVNFVWPSYGRALLDFCSSIYPGYHVRQTVGSVVCGSSYALFDGAVGGALFAWFYNRFAA
jgi:hypothetical protein